MERQLVILVALAAMLSTIVVDGCSMPEGWRPLSDVERILDATDVIYGQVRKVYPDMRFDYGAGTTAYTAEMEVFCVLKGRPTNQILNISEAGIIPGLCHSTNLTVGGLYVVIIRRDDETGENTPRSVEIDATAPAALDNVMSACNLQPVYPKGVEASNATVKCPLPLPPGRCKSKLDFEKSTNSRDNSVEHASSGNYTSQLGAVEAVRSAAATVSSTFNIPAVSLTTTYVMAIVLRLAAEV